MANIFLKESDLPETKTIFCEDLTEATGEKGVFIEGIFMQCDVKNRNGRIYPLENVLKTVADAQARINSPKRWIGELNHPENRINPEYERTSHIIKSFVQDGSNFIGRAKLIESHPCGAICVALAKEGIQLGVSTRGYGSVEYSKSRGADIIGKDFVLVTVDIVSTPSAPDAFTQAVFESKQWALQAFEDSEKLEEHKRRVNTAYRNRVIKERKQILSNLFNKVMKDLNG